MTLKSAEKLGKDIDETVDLMSKIEYANRIIFKTPSNQESAIFNNIEYAFDKSLQYDLNDGKIFDELKINLGSKELQRFSCAAHKPHIAVRMGINKKSTLSNIITKLNKYSS